MWTYDPAATGGVQVFLQNQGMWLRVKNSPKGGSETEWTDNTTVVLTHHGGVTTAYPPATSLQTARFALPARGRTSTVLNALVGGPSSFYTLGGSEGTTQTLQALNGLFGWSTLDTWSVAAMDSDRRVIALPFTAIRLVTTNASATTRCEDAGWTWYPSPPESS
jgi:hypothetical protein